eukprot:702186-Alexandrium_andersonii.AAC.1
MPPAAPPVAAPTTPVYQGQAPDAEAPPPAPMSVDMQGEAAEVVPPPLPPPADGPLPAEVGPGGGGTPGASQGLPPGPGAATRAGDGGQAGAPGVRIWRGARA